MDKPKALKEETQGIYRRRKGITHKKQREKPPKAQGKEVAGRGIPKDISGEISRVRVKLALTIKNLPSLTSQTPMDKGMQHESEGVRVKCANRLLIAMLPNLYNT